MFVSILNHTSLLVTFFEQHLLTSCLYATFWWILKYLKLFHCYCIGYGVLCSVRLDVTPVIWEGIHNVVVHPLNCVLFFATSWTTAHQEIVNSTVSWSLLKFMSIESMMLSNHLIICHPFLLLPSIFPSMRVFSNELALCIR